MVHFGKILFIRFQYNFVLTLDLEAISCETTETGCFGPSFPPEVFVNTNHLGFLNFNVFCGAKNAKPFVCWIVLSWPQIPKSLRAYHLKRIIHTYCIYRLKMFYKRSSADSVLANSSPTAYRHFLSLLPSAFPAPFPLIHTPRICSKSYSTHQTVISWNC